MDIPSVATYNQCYQKLAKKCNKNVFEVSLREGFMD